MAIRDYARMFAKFWWLTILLTAIGAAGGWIYKDFIDTPSYAATARLFVTAEGGTSVGESYQNNLFAQERVNSYAAIATSEQVSRRAAQALGGQVSAGDLRSETSAAAVPKTVILAVTVTDDSPRRAQSYANAVAQQTGSVVSELETSRRGGAPAADAVLLDDANLPTDSTGIGLITWIVLGAIIGLLLGLLVSLVFGLLDRRVRTGSSLYEHAGARLLAEIPDGRALTGEAVAAGDGDLEPYRRLRTNVRFIGAAASTSGTAPRTVTVAGPGSGIGRTSTAIGLAVGFADAGQDVLLIDADLAANGVARAMGIPGEYGLSSVVVGEGELSDGVATIREHLSVLAAGDPPPNPGELVASERFAKVLDEARRQFDFVVVDTPSTTVSSDAAVCAALSDATIVVARRNATNRDRLRAAVTSFASVGATVLGIVLVGGSGPMWFRRGTGGQAD